MRIQVTNIDTSDNFELTGHEAPILGLSLDPSEEFIVIIHFTNHIDRIFFTLFLRSFINYIKQSKLI